LADSESHIKSWKYGECTWVRAWKSKKRASIYSLCSIITDLREKSKWYSDSVSNSASGEDRFDIIQKEKCFDGSGSPMGANWAVKNKSRFSTVKGNLFYS